MSEDPKDRFESVARFSKRRRRGPRAVGRVAGGHRRGARAGCSRRCRRRSARSARPTWSTSSELAWQLRGLDVGSASDVTRLFAMSIGDLLREWFETDAVQAMLAVNGVIGTWAGPEAPGTAYVMLHHSIGDVGTGNVGAWGYPGAAWARCRTSIRRAAESLRCASCAPTLRSSGSSPAAAGSRASRSLDGEELAAPIVVAAIHPQIAFLRHLDPGVLPDDFVARIRRWRSRSGTVKVNLALSELPDFVADPGTDLQPHHTGAIELAHSPRLPRDGLPGGPQRPAGDAPVQRRLHPLDLRPHDLPRGHPRDEPVHAVGAGRVGRRAAPGRAGGLRRPGGRRLHRAGARTSSDRSSTAR